MTTNRMGLTPDQSANCFSDDELEMMQHENNPRSHAFRELLAYRKTSEETVAFINGAWTIVYYRPPKEMGLKIADKLYAAPPLQAVTVPDKATWRDAPVNSENVDWAAGWNACRAAMLKQNDK